MVHPFLSGGKVYLRLLIEEDLSGSYFDWLNDFEVTRFMETGRFPNTLEALHSFLGKYGNNNNFVTFAICEKGTNKHVGNAKLGPINWIHRVTDFGIMIGDKESWGKGYAGEATALVMEYTFTWLNLHKLNLGVIDDNKPAIHVYEKLGFKREGIRREVFALEGVYHDGILMGITESEYFSGPKTKGKRFGNQGGGLRTDDAKQKN